jgi:hypothetical protein
MSVRLMIRVFDLDLSSKEKLVLLAMADHASGDGSGCYPSIGTLMKKTSLSRRGVQGAIRSMEGAGFLVRIGKAEGGRRVTTEYSIDVDSHKSSGPKTDQKPKRNSAPRAPFPEQKGAKSAPKRAQNLHEKGAKSARNATRILIEPKTEPGTEPADAVAGGLFVGEERDLSGKNLRAISHRHPPYDANPKPDDDDRPRDKPNSSKPTNKTTHSDRGGFRKPTVEERKANALANIKEKYKNTFSAATVECEVDRIHARAIKAGTRIGSEKYFENSFDNLIDVRAAIAVETNVGAGPEIIPDPTYIPPAACAQCGRTEKFHNKTLHIKKHIDPHWIDHPFSLVVVDDVPDVTWDLTRQRF